MEAYERFRKYMESVARFSDRDMEIVRENSRIRKLRKRQNLLLEGDASKYLAWVATGCLRLYMVDSASNERILEFGMANGYVTDRASFLTGVASPYNIDAVTDSEVILFTLESLDVLGKAIPNYDQVIRNGVGAVLARYQTRILTTLTLTAEEKYRMLQEQDPFLVQNVPQHMVAAYMGLTPATLSRLRRRAAEN